MPHFEYKVVPAPTRAQKVKGVKSPEGRFAHSIEGELNRMGEAGWEYLRAELLPHEERSGLKATQTKWRTVLIFRRSVESDADQLHARVLDAAAPSLEPAVPQPMPMPEPVPLVADPLPEPEIGEDEDHQSTVVPLPGREEDKQDR